MMNEWWVALVILLFCFCFTLLLEIGGGRLHTASGRWVMIFGRVVVHPPIEAASLFCPTGD